MNQAILILSVFLGVAGCFTHAAERPHIIFIEVDDLAYTCASPWGSKTARTPTLDRLAAKGFVFDQTMCQGMMRGPSRNSLISGRYPHQIGFYQNGDLKKLPADSWALPKALRRARYHTAWIGKSHLKPYAAKKSDGDTFKPFFGFDHAVHTLGRVLLGRNEDDGGDADAPNPYMQHLAQRGFHANIHFMDAQVQRLLTALERKGMLDNAWVVFLSDHGVMQGAHGLIHKHTLFRQVTQPSLIIRPAAGAAAGKRIAQPVELLDLLPTFLDVAGAASEKGPNGVSLMPLLTGQGEFARRHSFGEIENWSVVSEGRHRLLRSQKGEMPLLFDDQADPENLTNLAAAHPEIVTQLGRAIDDWLKQTGRRLPPNKQKP